METVVAYAFDRPVGAEHLAAGVRRMEGYYGDLWQGVAKRDSCETGLVGVHSWSRRDPTCNWPAWYEDNELAIATLHAPLGYETIVGDLPPDKAVSRLARAAIASPAALLELAPPFVLTVVDRADERLELFTDSMGLGRLFHVRTADGWIWSNRPAAACLFADVPAAAAARGWRYAAGSSWFMGDSTPYDGVLAVPGGTRIVMDGRRRRRTVTRVDATSIWSGDLSPRSVEETADALRGVAHSVSRLWPGTPTVDLSGGRDSRVVAAAFLSAGVDLRLNSYDAVPGELQVAEDLVALLPQEIDHVVKRPAAPATPAPLPELVERIRKWHRYGEGLRPASYLFHTPPEGLADVAHLAIGGAGGEVAHGHFYPRDVLALDQRPLETKLDLFTERLQTRLAPAAGPVQQVQDAVSAQIRQVFREAIQGGLEDAKMLDYFYLVERLRRWGTTAERSGVVSPLLVPAFVRGAFALTSAQRLENALHQALVRELVPQWADIPFFKPAPVAKSTPPQVKRLAAVPDRELVQKLLKAPTDDFDGKVIGSLWASSVAGKSTAADEVALRQLLWRAVFDDHLAEVNLHITRRPVQKTARPPVRRTLRTRVGRRLRRLKDGING